MSHSNPSTEFASDSGPVLPGGVEKVFGDLRGKTDGDLLALSYDGPETLRTVEEGGILRKFDARNGQLLDMLTLSDLENCWAFSPDGRLLVSGADGVSIWDVDTGMLIDRLEESAWTLALTFSPDGRYIASAHDDLCVRIWDRTTGRLVCRLMDHESEVSAIAFSVDGSELAAADEDKIVIVWDCATGKVKLRLVENTDRIDALAWSPTGDRIASAGWDTSARIWDSKTGQLLAILNGQGECVHAAAFIAEGDRLATADSEGKVRVWDYRNLKVLGLLDRHSAAVGCLAISPDGKQLATGGSDRGIHLWNLSDYAPVTGASANPTPVRSVRFESGRLAAVHQDGGLACWDAASGERLDSVVDGDFRSIAATGKGRVVAGDLAGRVHVLDADLKQQLRSWKAGDDAVRRLAVDPKGTTLASTAGLDGTVKIWALETGEPTLIIPNAAGGCAVEAIAFHPRLPMLAVGGVDWMKSDEVETDGRIAVWDLESHAPVCSLPGGALRLAFHPAGDLVAAVTVQRSVVIWDVAKETILQELGQEECFFSSLAFSPDGRFLAVGSEQNYLRLWACSDWSVRTTWDLETAVNDLFFAPDQTAIYSANGNSTCYRVSLQTLS